MTNAEQHYHDIAAATPNGTESKMFGAKCVKAPNGKAAFFFKNECMVFKLTGDAVTEAMSLDGVDLFNPKGNRPMNGWYEVPTDYENRWEEFAAAAMDYVKGLE